MAYDRKDFRDELNAVFNDGSNVIWTEAQKNAAINEAIDALWPEIKNSAVDETVTLAANTFIYTPTAIPPETGFYQAFLEQGTNDPYRFVRGITQNREEVTGVLKWKIHVPSSIVSGNAGKKIRLRYHSKFVHYTNDTVEQDVPWLPVLYYACMMLCIYMLQKAGSSNIIVWRDQIPTWQALWTQSKKSNLTASMIRYIGFEGA